MAGPIPPQNGGTGIENSNTISLSGGDIDIQLPGNLTVSLPITLDKAYINGGEINILDVNPFLINTLGQPINCISIPTSPSSTASNSQDRIEGFGFIPSVDIWVSALQYRAVNFTAGGTRHVGLYREGDQVLLADDFVATTDPLDSTSTWYTKTLAIPVKLISGTQYGIAVVVPSGEAYDSFATAVPDANININEVWDGPDTSTLQFPFFIIAQSNQPMSGAFQYRLYDEGVKVSNDGEVIEVTKENATGAVSYNRESGSATLVAGTVTISSSLVQAGDFIAITCVTAGGTQGIVTVTKNSGVSIVLTSSNASDTSTYEWQNLG